jgi:hypothetical protein
LASAAAYIGGLLTKPIQDHMVFLRKRHDIKVCLYSELARLYCHYVNFGLHSELPIKVSSDNEAYKFAMKSPEVYYTLREHTFFDSLYRSILNFEGKRQTPVVAKTS